MIVGVSHEPMKAVMTIPNNVAIYSPGIGGGSSLKFAVKLPKLVTLRVAALSYDLILKNLEIEFRYEVIFTTSLSKKFTVELRGDSIPKKFTEESKASAI